MLLIHPLEITLMKKRLEKKHIQVKWVNYGDYPEYSQSWGEFEHNVSVLDLLFNCGKNLTVL